MEREIREFIDSIGASEPSRKEENYDIFRKLFKRSHYFRLKGKLLIVKISRSKRPFFGLTKDILDVLDTLKINNYFLALLVSNKEGWIYSKSEVQSNINNSAWKLRQKDKNYKINPNTLKDDNLFTSPAQFLNKFDIYHE